MIAVLVLLEDREQSVVDFLWLLVFLGLLLEGDDGLGNGEESETPYPGEHSGARVGLGESLEDTDVEGVHSGSSQLLQVHVEPEVVGPVTSQVVLITIKMNVPHF